MNDKQLLRYLGAVPTYKGYHYLLKAMELVREDPYRLTSTKKEIYYVIAEYFNVEDETIEANVRCVLRRMWKEAPSKMKVLVGEETEERPSITEFLSSYHALFLPATQ